MIVEIPSYKYIEEPQQIDLTINKICTLMGGNGSGKSTILESIFGAFEQVTEKRGNGPAKYY